MVKGFSSVMRTSSSRHTGRHQTTDPIDDFAMRGRAAWTEAEKDDGRVRREDYRRRRCESIGFPPARVGTPKTQRRLVRDCSGSVASGAANVEMRMRV
jgi:hypothetical protein